MSTDAQPYNYVTYRQTDRHSLQYREKIMYNLPLREGVMLCSLTHVCFVLLQCCFKVHDYKRVIKQQTETLSHAPGCIALVRRLTED